MKAVVFALPGNERLAGRLAAGGRIVPGSLSCGRFPDGESHVRLDTEVAGREAILACSLDRPDDKLLALAFAASAARDMGAARVGLVAPYLAYLRQDRRFRDGEALSSACFARLLGATVDWLLCVDPHLHRYKSLEDIYSIPAVAVPAAPAIARWLRGRDDRPLLIGPDEESEQWVSEVARLAGAPYAVLRKRRLGDREVEIELPRAGLEQGRTPVLLDDIISSAGTMMTAVKALIAAGLPPPLCIGVHAVFAPRAHAGLLAAGAAGVVSCNTIEHASNGIDVHGLIASGVEGLLR